MVRFSVAGDAKHVMNCFSQSSSVFRVMLLSPRRGVRPTGGAGCRVRPAAGKLSRCSSLLGGLRQVGDVMSSYSSGGYGLRSRVDIVRRLRSGVICVKLSGSFCDACRRVLGGVPLRGVLRGKVLMDVSGTWILGG